MGDNVSGLGGSLELTTLQVCKSCKGANPWAHSHTQSLATYECMCVCVCVCMYRRARLKGHIIKRLFTNNTTEIFFYFLLFWVLHITQTLFYHHIYSVNAIFPARNWVCWKCQNYRSFYETHQSITITKQ